MHHFDVAHSDSQNKGNLVFGIIELLHRLFADHAPVGDDTEVGYIKTSPDSFHYRDQRLYVGGVAVPHLTAQRTPVIIEDGSDHHLIEIGTIVFAEALLADSLSSLSLKIDGCRIEEDEIQPGKKVAVQQEKPLFDNVLGASGSEGSRTLLVFNL